MYLFKVYKGRLLVVGGFFVFVFGFLGEKSLIFDFREFVMWFLKLVLFLLKVN